MFLEKLEIRVGYLFTNTKRGCYVSELAKFYANNLGELLGVSAESFDAYVHEERAYLVRSGCWN